MQWPPQPNPTLLFFHFDCLSHLFTTYSFLVTTLISVFLFCCARPLELGVVRFQTLGKGFTRSHGYSTFVFVLSILVFSFRPKTTARRQDGCGNFCFLEGGGRPGGCFVPFCFLLSRGVLFFCLPCAFERTLRDLHFLFCNSVFFSCPFHYLLQFFLLSNGNPRLRFMEREGGGRWVGLGELGNFWFGKGGFPKEIANTGGTEPLFSGTGRKEKQTWGFCFLSLFLIRC